MTCRVGIKSADLVSDGGLFDPSRSRKTNRRTAMGTMFQNETSTEVTKAVSIAGGWLVGWSGVLLLLAFV
jgi:hypothetical protein